MKRWRRKPELVEWIKRIEIGPGEVLALKIDREMSAEQAAHVRDQLAEALPAGTYAFLIQHDMEIAVIGRRA